jgi:hypothetical protein
MRSVVVYESMFGNTEQIARAVGAGLAEYGPALTLEVGVVPADAICGVDLIVVGAPTHAFGLPRPESRADAASRLGHAPVSAGIGIREWLDRLPPGDGTVAAAAFCTRTDKHWVPGSAARKALKRLRSLGYRVAENPEDFYVAGMTGPLDDGELSRATAWGRGLGAAASQRLTAQRARG